MNTDRSLTRLEVIIAQGMVSAEKIDIKTAEQRVMRMKRIAQSKLFVSYIENGILDNTNWYPACGGTEEPFQSRTGKRLMYVWCPITNRHAYLDMGSDILLSNEEANVAMGLC